MRGKLVRNDRRFAYRCEQVSAPNVDVVLKHQCHGVARAGARNIAISADDFYDASGMARRRDHHLIADRDLT
jgi:hypothetical protein